MKGNIGIGKANKPKSVSVKTVHKSPIKGQAMNSALYHATKGKKGMA